MTTGTSPIRGWWWRTSQPTAVRTPVLPGPRWRAGGSPIVAGSSFRTRLCSGEPWLPSPASGGGDAAAAVVELPGCSPVLEQTDGQLGFAGGGAGLWPVTRLPGAAAGRAAAPADTPEGYGPRGKDFISHVTFPPEILDAWRQLREDAQLAGALQARPRLKNARLRQIRRKRAICVIKM